MRRVRTRVGPQSTKAAPRLDVDGLLDDPSVGIIVCCGSGGVGKTTTSAALGLRAAERGRRVVVLTIDPARRLAQSMGIADLHKHGLPVGGVVVNLVRPRELGDKALVAVRNGKVDTAAVTADLKRAGLDADDALVDGLLAEAHDHAERRALEDEQHVVVAGLDVPTYELPRLTAGIDLGALYELAGMLRDQGMA